MSIYKREAEFSENQRYKRGISDLALSGAIATSSLYFGGKLALSLEIPASLGFQKQGLRFLGAQTVGGIPLHQALGRNPDGTINVYELILNAVKASEEQLFKIPRAFSAYSLMSEPYLSKILSANELSTGQYGYAIPKDIAVSQLDYLKSISRGKITKSNIENLIFTQSDSKLFGLIPKYSLVDKDTGEILLDNARAGFNYWNKAADEFVGPGERKKGFVPRYNQAANRMRGFKPSKADIWFTGGQSFFAAQKERLSANIAVGTENYMKLLDDPFEIFTGFLERTLGEKNVPRFLKKGSKFWDAIGARNILGVGGWQEMSRGGGSIHLLKKHAMRGLPVLAAGIYAFKTADELLRRVPILDGTALGGGLKGLAGSLWQDLTLFGSTVSDLTGLTKLNDWQEKNAPGSQNLTALAAFPATLAIAGATAGGIENLLRKEPVGELAPPPRFFSNAVSVLEDTGIGKKVSSFLGLSKKGRVGAYALTGAAIGLAAVLPFIPGALGSEYSRKELEEIYSGDKLMPVKRNRAWEFGIGAYEGNDTEFYEPHKTVQWITDAHKKSRLGSFYGKPITRLITKILDPHYLSRAQDEERPYVYWGPTDYGGGFIEKLLTPVKEVFTPTVKAHSDAVGVIHPSRMKRGIDPVPEELQGTDEGIVTRNDVPEAARPDSLSIWAKESADSFRSMLGLIGFTYGSVIDKATGSQGFLTQDAVYETSGRIMSAQRSYWDQSYGGMGMTNEFLRRLNPDRPYGTEYVQAAIRNTQPEWVPNELRYGDPFSSIPQGDIRLPGKGYAAIHPELENVDYEDYPAIHRYNILSDVAPDSAEYNRAKFQVLADHAEGALDRKSERLLRMIQEREEERSLEDYGEFDYGEGNLANRYYHTLKKIGRSLPTESLYPISPAHKFMGPVDPMTEYKSFISLDSSFKEWSNPIADYIQPAFNRLVDLAAPVDFTPSRTVRKRELQDYFQQVQAQKNIYLKEEASQAAMSGNRELASYYRSGVRRTTYDTSTFADLEEQASLLAPQERKIFRALSFESDPEKQSRALKLVGPDMQKFLRGQWAMSSMMNQGDFETLDAVQRMAMENPPPPPLDYGDMPSRDWLGYAPGVDLNAFKLKVATNLGRNIRDYGLWKEDERQARLLDTVASNKQGVLEDYAQESQAAARRRAEAAINSIGMTSKRISMTPIAGKTVVEMHTRSDNKERLRENMIAEGMILY